MKKLTIQTIVLQLFFAFQSAYMQAQRSFDIEVSQTAQTTILLRGVQNPEVDVFTDVVSLEIHPIDSQNFEVKLRAQKAFLFFDLALTGVTENGGILPVFHLIPSKTAQGRRYTVDARRKATAPIESKNGGSIDSVLMDRIVYQRKEEKALQEANSLEKMMLEARHFYGGKSTAHYNIELINVVHKQGSPLHLFLFRIRNKMATDIELNRIELVSKFKGGGPHHLQKISEKPIHLASKVSQNILLRVESTSFEPCDALLFHFFGRTKESEHLLELEIQTMELKYMKEL